MIKLYFNLNLLFSGPSQATRKNSGRITERKIIPLHFKRHERLQIGFLLLLRDIEESRLLRHEQEEEFRFRFLRSPRQEDRVPRIGGNHT